MKKLFVMILVAAMVMGLTVLAHGETTDATINALRQVKTYRTAWSLEGEVAVSQFKDENGYYPCIFYFGDMRDMQGGVVIPLTEDEVNELMLKALTEAEEKRENDNPSEDRGWFANAIDWITFWN